MATNLVKNLTNNCPKTAWKTYYKPSKVLRRGGSRCTTILFAEQFRIHFVSPSGESMLDTNSTLEFLDKKHVKIDQGLNVFIFLPGKSRRKPRKTYEDPGKNKKTRGKSKNSRALFLILKFLTKKCFSPPPLPRPLLKGLFNGGVSY